MTRFVAALLIDAGGPVRIQVDPRVPRPEDIGPLRAAALLAQAHRAGRAQRAEGVEAVVRAGRRVQVGQQRRGGQP